MSLPAANPPGKQWSWDGKPWDPRLPTVDVQFVQFSIRRDVSCAWGNRMTDSQAVIVVGPTDMIESLARGAADAEAMNMVFIATVPAERVFEPPWDSLGLNPLSVVREQSSSVPIGLAIAGDYLSQFRSNFEANLPPPPISDDEVDRLFAEMVQAALESVPVLRESRGDAYVIDFFDRLCDNGQAPWPRKVAVQMIANKMGLRDGHRWTGPGDARLDGADFQKAIRGLAIMIIAASDFIAMDQGREAHDLFTEFLAYLRSEQRSA
jgi:hypothetical protein